MVSTAVASGFSTSRRPSSVPTTRQLSAWGCSRGEGESRGQQPVSRHMHVGQQWLRPGLWLNACGAGGRVPTSSTACLMASMQVIQLGCAASCCSPAAASTGSVNL